MLFERLAEGIVAFIARRQRHLADIDRAHAQLAPGSFHAHPPDIDAGTLPHLLRKDAVEVRHGKASDGCQRSAVKRLGTMIFNIPFHGINTLRFALAQWWPKWCFPRHAQILPH